MPRDPQSHIKQRIGETMIDAWGQEAELANLREQLEVAQAELKRLRDTYEPAPATLGAEASPAA